jgi:hypothetical protein
VPHFIPTSSSWLNLVERWFRERTEKAVRRAAFFSVPDLIQAIEAFLGAWNENPRPFVWTAKSEEFVQKIERARASWNRFNQGAPSPGAGEKATNNMSIHFGYTRRAKARPNGPCLTWRPRSSTTSKLQRPSGIRNKHWPSAQIMHSRYSRREYCWKNPGILKTHCMSFAMQ